MGMHKQIHVGLGGHEPHTIRQFIEHSPFVVSGGIGSCSTVRVRKVDRETEGLHSNYPETHRVQVLTDQLNLIRGNSVILWMHISNSKVSHYTDISIMSGDESEVCGAVHNV